MILLEIFAVGSVSYVTVRYVLPMSAIAGILAVGGALGLLLACVTFVALWFDNHSGVSSMMVHSWQFLSGVNSPSEVVNTSESDCHYDNLPFLLWVVVWLTGLVFVIGNGFIGLFAIVGMPAGIIGSIISAGATLNTQKIEFLQVGLLCLLVPLAAVIIFGVDLRIIHIWTNWQDGCTG